MEDNDLTSQFNELHSLAQGFLASVQTELEHAQKNSAAVNEEIQTVRRELNDVKTTNKNLSAELAKEQRTHEFLEGERNRLNGEKQQLQSRVSTLTVELAKEQRTREIAEKEKLRLSNENSQLKSELTGLKSKWEQARKFFGM